MLFHDGRSCLVPEIHQSADTAVTPFDAAVQNCGVRVVQRDDGVRLQAEPWMKPLVVWWTQKVVFNRCLSKYMNNTTLVGMVLGILSY